MLWAAHHDLVSWPRDEEVRGIPKIGVSGAFIFEPGGGCLPILSGPCRFAHLIIRPGFRAGSSTGASCHPTRIISEVEAQTREKYHRPDIPSEAEAKREGLDRAAMQVKLLQKIKELTLYIITLEKRTRFLEQNNSLPNSNPEIHP